MLDKNMSYLLETMNNLGQFDDLHDVYKQLSLSEHLKSALKQATSGNTTSPILPFRSVLLLKACELVGGEIDETTRMAAEAMETFATFLHIHDDIIDKATITSSFLFPSVNSQFGDGMALVVGDVLLVRAIIALCKALYASLGNEKAEWGINEFGRTAMRIADAQSAEIELMGCLDVREHNYLRIAENKTAEYALCMKIGALIGNSKEEELISLGEYGRQLGIILQMRSDLHDTFYRRDLLRNRLSNEIAPLPVILAAGNSENAYHFFSSLIHKDTISDDEWLEVFRFISKSDAEAHVVEIIQKCGREAKSLLQRMNNREPKRFFETLIDVAMECR